MEITGGCLCGAVRFSIGAQPIVTRICWCRLCQYLAAGNGTVNACFPKEAVRVQGTLRGYRSVADSGNVMLRRFCPACGTQLFSECEARPAVIFVRAGALDDSEVVRPAATIWVSRAPSWACINQELVQVQAQPPPVT